MSENINIAISENPFLKRPIEDILRDSESIDASKISSEILTWLINNVENFIDNQAKMFKLDLVVDNVKGMEETKKLQDLYRAIPDEEDGTPMFSFDQNAADKTKNNYKLMEEASNCRRTLDKITAKSFEEMNKSKDTLNQLFKRMIFYYEKIIPSVENKKRAQKIDEELKNLIEQKEECVSHECKKKIQNQIIEKIKEGENLVKFEELYGQVNITNFDYEAFSVGVKIMPGNNVENENDNEEKILKQYVIPEGFTVWLEIIFKYKQRPTTMF